MTRRTIMAACLATIAATLWLKASAAVCSLNDVTPRWLVVWRVGGGAGGGGQQFRCVLTRPQDVARVQSAIASGGSAGIPFGRVRFGTVENFGHHWHMENVRLVDVTIEIYDGRPSDIDRNLMGWITTIKRFAPWSARPVQIFPMQ